MDYSYIPGSLLKLANGLCSLVPAWLMSKKDQADRFAAYCERIADLLDDTVEQLRRGRRPHGNCAELDRHMHNVNDLLRKHVSDDDLAQLSADLYLAYKVEYLDLAFSDPNQVASGLVATEQAAGRFRALAAILRAGG